MLHKYVGGNICYRTKTFIFNYSNPILLRSFNEPIFMELSFVIGSLPNKWLTFGKDPIKKVITKAD